MSNRVSAPVLAAAILLIAALVAPLAAPAVQAAQPIPAPANTVRPEDKIAPELLSSRAYRSLLGVEDLDNALYKALEAAPLRPYKSPGELARVTIYYMGGDSELSEISSHVYRVTAVLKTGRLSVAFALATRDQVESLARLPFVLRIEPQKSLLDEVQTRTPPEALGGASGAHLPVASVVETSDSASGFPIYSAPKLTGAEYVWEKYGINGSGVKIAIVDTGVDLGSPDLGPAKVAMDENGVPLVFDADEIGFTPMVLVEKINDTAINVTGPEEYNGMLLVFYPLTGQLMLTDSAFAIAVNVITGDRAVVAVPLKGSVYRIPEAKGAVTFGAALQYVIVYYLDKGIPFYGVLLYTVPVAFTDTDGDGLFDTVYPDLSTAYYLVSNALSQTTGGAAPAAPEDFADYSLTDEPALSYGGNVVASRDFTGDGVPDFSAGALAGAFYDYYGLLGPSTPYGLDWKSDWEPTAYVVPGIDVYHGMWIDLVYDFHGHGTSCAHVAAATGETPRTLYSTAPGVSFETTMPGMAPGAEVGGAVALFNGDVVTAELWLAGFDQVNASTYTWEYTGKHQVDVISNSWGSSWLLIAGYASDAEPSALWEDYITAMSGTVIVHAAGNGGPGFGSVTMPGSAAFVITVGAAVDFYYRPLYGIGNSTYLPGGYGLVVSWSDRGPTELGYPKPDVLAIGSFEWAGTRAIDSIYDGTYAYELFSGTSEATPMTAGAVALIIQALREAGIEPTPLLVKAVLKSSADDVGFNGFSQGSGFIDVARAVDTVMEGGYIAYSYDSALNILEQIDETMAAMLGVSVADIWKDIAGMVADTAIYTGPMVPGSEKNVGVIVKSLGGAAANVTLSDYTLRAGTVLSLSQVFDVSRARLVGAAQNGAVVSLDASGLFMVGSDGKLYLNVSALARGSRVAIPLTPEAEEAILRGNMTVISLDVPASYHFAPQPDGRPNPLATLFYPGWELVVWFDLNENGVIDAYQTANGYYYETARLNYDIREGPASHLEIGNPQKAILRAAEAVSEYTGIPVEDLLQVAHLAVELRVFANAWFNKNVAPMPLGGSATVYDAVDCGMLSGPSTVTVEGGEAVFNVTVDVPATVAPGIYEAFLVVHTPAGDVHMPVSIPVAKVVDPAASLVYTISGKPQGYVYDNYAFRPALDQGWRPEVGDWRVYPLAIPASSAYLASSLQVVVLWENPAADYDAALIGPGLNFWGVGDLNYLEYVDAAVLGGKLTYPGIVGGVYTYFDYPMPNVASFFAPLDPLRNLGTGGYAFYWLVVHQKFSDTDGETPTVLLKFGLFTALNYYEIQAGTTGSITATYLSPSFSTVELLDYDLIPLTPGASGLQVEASISEEFGLAHTYTIAYNAAEATPGLYVFLALVMEPQVFSVIVGYTDPSQGFPGGLAEPYKVPMIYPVAVFLSVTG